MLKYINNQLHLDGVNLEDISDFHGTPSYIYSRNEIIKNLETYKEAFSEFNPLICYAVKALSNLSVLKIIADQGCGFDCVSEGEFRRTQLLGMNTKKHTIVSGVGKSDAELEYYVGNDILLINAESVEELIRINKISQKFSKITNVGIRINPDVNAFTLEKISTGKKDDKFGINIADFLYHQSEIQTLKNININSVSFHIGSQITSVDPYQKAYKVVAAFIEEIRSLGFNPTYIDIGGGVGIQYSDEKIINIKELATCYRETLGKLALKLIIEPGRSIVGNTGVLLSRVIDIKRTQHGTSFIILDAGMNDNMRPAMYGAHHNIRPVNFSPDNNQSFQVVGPICESSDIFTKDFQTGNVKRGDLIVILDCGAYCYSMSSNYNTRLLPNEILIQDGNFHLVKKRQTYEDLFNSEIVI